MKYVFTSSIHIYQYRKRLMHYTLISTFKQIIEDVDNAMKESVEFVEKEAQKDFQSLIANYRKYAAILKEFKL